MSRPLIVILLAGRIRPSPLSEALDVPVLCLPVGPCGSLLDEWLRAVGDLPGLQSVRAVVNTPAEEESVRAILRASCLTRWGGPEIRVMAEPAAWRGAAGIVRDVADDLPEDAIVLVCESKRLPPSSMQPLLDALEQTPQAVGAVGVCGRDYPAGVSVFSREALELIPPIGYFDLKEQFLPALSRHGKPVVKASLDQAVWRLHDVESYLECVRHSLSVPSGESKHVRASNQASISPSAIIEGSCIIEAGAVIEDGAVVHDSVILWGATVGGGAVVTRSVVGSLVTVSPRSRITRTVMARQPERRSEHRLDMLEGADANRIGEEELLRL